MIHGAYKSYQNGSSKLVALFGKTIELYNLSLQIQIQEMFVHAERRLGHYVIQVNQQQNVQLYNRYMNGVDCHDQMCMNYDVGHFSVKATKCILWYL